MKTAARLWATAAALIAPLASATSTLAADLSQAPVVTGKFVLPSGVPLKNYPLLITGTIRGPKGIEQINMVVPTDMDGVFSVRSLQSGTYDVAPAAFPDATTKFYISPPSAVDAFLGKYLGTARQQGHDLGTIVIGAER